MPRIRTIKPEFWADEKLSPMPPIARLVFLGLISMADDAGRVVDSVRAIDGFLFPETTDTAAEALDQLAELGRIERGLTSSGQRVIQIVRWAQHQRIDKPNLAAALPEIVFDDASAKRRRRVSPAIRRAIYDRDGGVCQQCGRVTRLDKRDRYDSDDDLAEVHHIKPFVDGGGCDPQNLQLLCLGCNRQLAGEAVRLRNQEQSTTNPRNVVEASTPRSTIYDLRPTTNDLGPVAAATRDDFATVLVSAANRGITERYGEQPNPLRWDAPSSVQAAEKIASKGVPIDFARDATYTAAAQCSLSKPPRSLGYFVDGVIERWEALAIHREASRSSARALIGAGAPLDENERFVAEAEELIAADRLKRGQHA